MGTIEEMGVKFEVLREQGNLLRWTTKQTGRKEEGREK